MSSFSKLETIRVFWLCSHLETWYVSQKSPINIYRWIICEWMNNIKYIQFLSHIFKGHKYFHLLFLPNSHNTMIYNLQHSQMQRLVVIWNLLIPGNCRYHPFPLGVPVLHYGLSKPHPSYHVIAFIVFFFLFDLLPCMNSVLLEIIQHESVCPFHILSGNMIATAQVMRPCLHKCVLLWELSWVFLRVYLSRNFRGPGEKVLLMMIIEFNSLFPMPLEASPICVLSGVRS